MFGGCYSVLYFLLFLDNVKWLKSQSHMRWDGDKVPACHGGTHRGAGDLGVRREVRLCAWQGKAQQRSQGCLSPGPLWMAVMTVLNLRL